MIASGFLFAAIASIGFAALCIFASRFLETQSGTDLVGCLFGAALLLVSVLTLPGAA